MNNQTKEILGIFITQQEVANMKVDHIHVTDFAIQTILKTVHLNQDSQNEIVDKLVDRNPNWARLTPESQINKIKVALTQETVAEYLRLNKYISENVDMLEMGIDKEGSIVVSAFYIEQPEAVKNALPQLSEEEVNEMEAQMNILDGSIDILGEAKKKLESMDKVVPFQNRAARRLAKSKKKVRYPHK